MEHVVFFPGPDGAPSFRLLSSLDDAVRLLEHLRNVENVSEGSGHTLSPGPLPSRPYSRVEVRAGEPAPESPVAPEPVAVPMEAAVPAPSEPVGEQVPVMEPLRGAEPVASDRRTLGFFAS